MTDNYRHMNVEPQENAFCVLFSRQRMTEQDVLEMGDEIIQLARTEDCPRIVFDFASSTPECLFSVFLAKLVGLQKKLEEMGGGFRLCNCNEQVLGVFKACRLDQVFSIYDSRQAALEDWKGA